MPAYVPDRSEIIWIDFDPQAGREQAKRRPALVLSPRIYNAKTNLLICCPITSAVKGYPFEVAVDSAKMAGVVLSDQVKSLDWKVRKAAKIERASDAVMVEVMAKVCALLQLN
ncbi:mRNA-degrading endonuclease [Bordetella genomosp. 9]|uniref:mRNA-degrading endonuclease n=1 Tax=Bordetella genomosp. 9 TaxID=1416803 RepID=A0A261R444_9BORD|nr:endoribonuclease MazF [Bordetella genomosp. 9]OZI19786.1 mRNA-degrading endonuclease [Bordetella genomosp. 9]